jgi:radical SAM protein with 4Fe4S-binding SPASM domain
MAWMKFEDAIKKIPELIFCSRLSFSFDEVPLIAERISTRKKFNLMKCGLDGITNDGSLCLPPLLQVEPTNVCNLKCPLCPTGAGAMKRKKGFMSVDTFRRIIDELGDVLLAAYLFCWGEPFLNRELPTMIGMCTNHNIRTLSSTNGHCLQTLDEAYNIINAGLSALIIALDGSTQEIYGQYRIGGDIDKVKRCVDNIEKAKAKCNSPYPYTDIRVVVTQNNIDDLPNIEKLSRDMGVNMFSYKTVGMMPHSETYKEYEPANQEKRRFEYDGSSRRSRQRIHCPYPFRQPTVFWDGTVVGCEHDYYEEMPWGRIGEVSFTKIWNSPNANRLRTNIRNEFALESFCLRCPYKDRVQDSCVIFCKELRPLGL